MKRTLMTLAACVAFAAGAACGNGGGDTPSPTLNLPRATVTGTTGGAGTTINPSGSLPPTSSPGITGTVQLGTAQASVTGSVNTMVTFTSLVSPAIWSPPPGAIALVWKGPAKQSFGLAGESFSSLQPTTAAHTLSLTLQVGDTTVSFQSSAGECNVTISPALSTNMGGTFLCTGLRSSDGSLTISANGTFSATG